MQMIGSIFGYLLWWLYVIVKNYGVAVILFTLIVKLLSFPLTIKSQKSMASQSRMAAKQKEIQTRYPNDKQKQNEELQKLYDKEGTNPMSGCLPMLLPMLVMFGIIWAVNSPLTNMLHIESTSVTAATEYIAKIPGLSASSTYTELNILRNFDALRDNLTQFFTAADIEKIDFLSSGVNFLGLNLLKIPGQSSFDSFMWLLPVLTLVVQFGIQFYTQKVNPAMQAAQGSQQGCMKWMMYLFPLLSVYYTYISPGALGFYWIITGLVQFLQTMVTNKYFSVHHMTARQEASRAVTLELKEQKLQPLPVTAQQQIARQLEAGPQPVSQKDKNRKNTNTSKKKQKNQSNNSSQYKGNKK